MEWDTVSLWGVIVCIGALSGWSQSEGSSVPTSVSDVIKRCVSHMIWATVIFAASVHYFGDSARCLSYAIAIGSVMRGRAATETIADFLTGIFKEALLMAARRFQ